MELNMSLKYKLTPQQQKIIDYLQDGEWHCMASVDFYMKDDRKRISELIAKGYVIEGESCKSIESGCAKQHSSKVYMRRLRQSPVVLKQRITFRETPTGRVAVIDLVPETPFMQDSNFWV